MGPFGLVRQVGSVEYSCERLVPGRARAMVANDPGDLAEMSRPNRPLDAPISSFVTALLF